jgi:uracil-DNA glycosylase family 4
MADLNRNVLLKQMGITQWVLRDTGGNGSPAQNSASPAGISVTNPVIENSLAASSNPSSISVASHPSIELGGEVDTSATSLDRLRDTVVNCTACGLASTRTQTVFGEGPDRTDWLFVGEAPGQQEDRQGQPFVGRAGGLLAQMIRALDMSREQVFIVNVLKCRPPNNRDPQSAEISACEPFLLKQIELVAPKVIVALGRVSAQALLGSEQPLGRLRGQVYQYGPGSIPLIVTYHPAYLLRQPADKGKVWEDLLLAHRQIRV